jgi:ABC-type polysaccharide/polyol phosphate transport system ATPase subunit
MPPSDSGRPAVVVDGVSKRFHLPHERRHTLKERALHPFSRPSADRLDALSDVSFAVREGEFFGVVGRNGSGKSTLLKCLAGIYRIDDGEIYVNGKVSPFIELGVGFHPELAARDNVVLNGIMLGLTPREAYARYERVIEFAELEEFVELKLKNYSSGMHVRLAFSVMVQVDADVLLIDEILAVGDAAFQQKCFDAFYRMRREGKTVIFVTHDMGAVARFCDRAMLLDRGEIKNIGEADRVADDYLRLNFERWVEGPDKAGARRLGAGGARVLEAWMEDEHGLRQSSFPQGSTCTFKAVARFEETMDDPSFEVAFVNAQQQNVFIAKTPTEGTGRFEQGETVTFTVSFENALAPGSYALSTLIARRGGGAMEIDRYEGIFSIMVTGARAAGGLVDLPHELHVDRAGLPSPEEA